MQRFTRLLCPIALCTVFHAFAANGDGQPQWGQPHTRNMISPETGLPESFNPETGENIVWTVSLGDSSYGSPIAAAGKIFAGANNAQPRDSQRDGDRAVLLCLDEATGALQWQLAVPRIGGDKYLDWPRIGMCSPPTIEGDRVYTVTNRYEVVCLDLNGLANGNDGPFQDEASYFAGPGNDPLPLSPLDADVIWKLDMVQDVGMYPHDGAHASILLDGPWLYLNTCNGVDNTHAVIRCPEAPSIIAVEKSTGRLVAKDAEGIGPRIFHSTWASPALGQAQGKPALFFGGGDGVLYAFDALPHDAPAEPVHIFQRIWRYDGDPTAPKENVHEYLKNKEVSPSIILGMPVLHANKVYVTLGGDIWWGKREAWLKCVDAGQGTEVWSYPLAEHAVSTASIHNGLLFITDCGGNIHCLDPETGQPYWTHTLRSEMWGSTLVADGKVYAGSRAGDFVILAEGKEKRVLAEIKFDAEVNSTPMAANGALYVATQETLYAIRRTQ